MLGVDSSLADSSIEPTSKRALNRVRREAAILDAAESLFAERGFRKTTIGEIASAAEVSRPLLYRLFEDKETLFAAVVERLYREWNAALVAEAARPTPSTGHTLRLVFVACLDFARQDRVRVLSLDARESIQGRGVLFSQGSKLLEDLISDILRRGIEQGDVRSDLCTEDLASVVTQTCLSYASLILGGHDLQISGDRADAVIETLLHGLVAR